MKKEATLSLLTFLPMIDSEACRLILAHHAVLFREEAHLLGWASIVALPHGFTPRIPLLYGDGLRAAGPLAIAQRLDKGAIPLHRLIPDDKALAGAVTAAWGRFNFTLGFAVAVFAYFHLLPRRDLMREPLSRGLPVYERRFLDRHYGGFTGLLRLLLSLNPAAAQKALATIRASVDALDKDLKDGRSYLFGEHFSLADIGVASALAPVLLPDGYGSPMPALESMPSEMRSLIMELRQREVGRFIRTIYRAHAAAAQPLH